MEIKKKILLVEDEAKIRNALKDFLDFQGFAVVEAVDGIEAIEKAAKSRPDLILLDLMLPKVSGEDVCRRWRQEGLQTPIIMLTAKGQQKDKIEGLNLGADDYITKPFSLEELLARIEAVLRRIDPARAVGQIFRFGDLDVDVSSLKARRGKKEIELSKREADIMQYFAANPRRVINRDELYEKVWHDIVTDIGTRTTDMHIAKLRGKIEADSENPKIITTVRGAGYRYEG
ncbi:MAG: response regulator transcription factor [Sedimentisphaerales bacterium]|nr:response regulator transcription factor [Sedimentisphaerales bacterium]